MSNNQDNNQWSSHQQDQSAPSAPDVGGAQGGNQQWQNQPNYGQPQGQPSAPQQPGQYPATHPPQGQQFHHQGQQFQSQGQQFTGGPAYQGSYGNDGAAAKKKKTLIITSIILTVILVITTVVLVIVLTGGDDNKGGDDGNGGTSQGRQEGDNGGGGDVAAREERIRDFVETQLQASGMDASDEILNEAVDCTVQVFAENLTDEQVDDILSGDYSSVPVEEQQALTEEVVQCMPTDIMNPSMP